MPLEVELLMLRRFLEEIESQIERAAEKSRWCVMRSDCLKAIGTLSLARMRTV